MIYVLIPARDEAPTVGLLLWKIRQVFTAFPREYQLLVANDGSTDATAETLEPYARALPLTVLRSRKHRGYAASLEALFREALERTDRPRRDLAVTLQADFSDAPEDIPEMIRRLEGGADMVLAARTRALGTGWSRLAQGLLPAALRSTLRLPGAGAAAGTLRAYRLGVVERLVRERGRAALLERDGRPADVELFVRTARHARRTEVVPAGGTGIPAHRPSRARLVHDAMACWRAARELRTLSRTPAEVPDRSEATPLPPREQREPVERREQREPRGRREQHGPREQRPPREQREQRPAREQHEPRPPREQRPPRDRHEPRPPREPREQQAPRDQGEPREQGEPLEQPAAQEPREQAAANPNRRRRRRGGRGRRRGGRGGQQGGQGSQPGGQPGDQPVAQPNDQAAVQPEGQSGGQPGGDSEPAPPQASGSPSA